MNIENMQTPIIKISEINSNNIYVKREDLIPYSFGGNKARKAVLFFSEIDNGQYNAVVTYGSSSSNHCRIVANLCKERNIPCFIISPEEKSEITFNSKLMNILGANVQFCPVSMVHDTIDKKIYELEIEGFKPYFIPGGGHGILGTQAYVNCYEEIRNFDVDFDYIFHASGTGTTQAGLVCGKLLNNDKCDIVGISIARKCPYGRDVVFNSCLEYLKDKVKKEDINKALIFEDKYIGDGYAVSNDEITKTIVDVFSNDGLPLDNVYTGKAFYGMTKYIKEHNIENKNILFIHTGGTPLFFDTLGKLLK